MGWDGTALQLCLSFPISGVAQVCAQCWSHPRPAPPGWETPAQEHGDGAGLCPSSVPGSQSSSLGGCLHPQQDWRPQRVMGGHHPQDISSSPEHAAGSIASSFGGSGSALSAAIFSTGKTQQIHAAAAKTGRHLAAAGWAKGGPNPPAAPCPPPMLPVPLREVMGLCHRCPQVPTMSPRGWQAHRDIYAHILLVVPVLLRPPHRDPQLRTALPRPPFAFSPSTSAAPPAFAFGAAALPCQIAPPKPENHRPPAPHCQHGNSPHPGHGCPMDATLWCLPADRSVRRR